jgi:DNA repair ATPase RecN
MNMNNKIFTSIIFIFLTSLFSVTLSHAETTSTNQNSSEILTQSELSQCSERSKHLVQTATQLKGHASQLKSQKDEMNQLAQDRSKEYADLDFQSPASVDEYNQVNKRLNHLTQTYSPDVKIFNEAVKQYKIDISQLKNDCNNKHYYPGK